MDWVMMDCATPDKPEIGRMAATLGLGIGDTFMAFFRWVRWLEKHCVDGTVMTTAAFIDASIACPGFTAALLEVSWLQALPTAGYTVPKFDRFNGVRAKLRACETTRKRLQRDKVRDIVPDKLRDKVRDEPPSPLLPPSHSPSLPHNLLQNNTAGAGEKQASPSPEPFEWDPVVGWSRPPPGLREAWAKAFPSVNIDGELAKAHAYLFANPKRAGKRDWKRFMNNWLARTHERGPWNGQAHNHTTSAGGRRGEGRGAWHQARPDNRPEGDRI